MEILIQPESRGIHYEGYENDYIQCVFEDGDVSGKNERYEFRCRPDLECCGRVCCIPQDATVPFWLMILFVVLALLLLFAVLGTIAWLCSKRKTKPKPSPKPQKTSTHRHDLRGGYTNDSGYRSMKQHNANDRLNMENAYSTPADNLSPLWHGYGNPMYGRGRGNTMHASDDDSNCRRQQQQQQQQHYDRRNSGVYDKAGGADHSEVIVPIEKRHQIGQQHNSSNIQQHSRNNGSRSTLEEEHLVTTPRNAPPLNSAIDGGDYYRETFEEKFEEKYEIDERRSSVSPTDSRELL